LSLRTARCQRRESDFATGEKKRPLKAEGNHLESGESGRILRSGREGVKRFERFGRLEIGAGSSIWGGAMPDSALDHPGAAT
jgi:hypothetical protein